MVKVPLKKVRVVSVVAGHSSSELVTCDVTLPMPPWEKDQRTSDCVTPSREGSDNRSTDGRT